MEIEIPEKLSGYTFYNDILPNIYNNIISKCFELDFDMSKTKLANPEGLINFLSAILMINKKYNYIPKLKIPISKNLRAYLELTNFLDISRILNQELFKIDSLTNLFYNKEKFEGFIPKIYGILTQTNSNEHFSNINKILENIKISLNEKTGFMDENEFRNFNIYTNLQSSLSQLIRNTIEHNCNYRTYNLLGFYMAQRTPYNTIELAYSDIGKGFRDRIIEMINEHKDSEIEKYITIQDKISDKKYLLRESELNPNLISIKTAVDFRSNSEIPGLFQIRKYTLSKNGSFFVHSGNYSVKYSNEKVSSKYYNSYFSGCHIRMELPI